MRAFLAAGIRVAVVHGGGPQATELAEAARVSSPPWSAGRRVTDEATLEVMKMTLAGQVSVDVASAFRLAGVPALCTTGVSAGLVDAMRRPPKVITGAGPDPVDLGLVGDVIVGGHRGAASSSPARASCRCWARWRATRTGNVFNINADTVATRVAAQAPGREAVPGLQRARRARGTRTTRPRACRSSPPPRPARRWRRASSPGGMIPKVEESAGDARGGHRGDPHRRASTRRRSILEEAREPGSRGTAFVR